MRLSSIKLAGFKSFVEATKIPFVDQMTCVVGPNGCGKSNVIDAVRWVLGESSAKNLRGDAMTDVIFNGSSSRKPISQASVELNFDNTQGRLPGTLADRNQISIKRLVTRDGQSLYFLNGSKCRKRDITDIFLGTGLGPRSYAIIEQGMISRLIESKPQELRVFLEEAAGVSKYKERRRETQTRIKSTRENLERLLDVRQELQNQLDKLANQAKDAQSYKELKAKERTLKGQIAVLKWQGFHQKQLDKAQQIAALQSDIEFLTQAHGGHDDVLASLENEVEHCAAVLEAEQQNLHKTHTDLTRAEQQKIHLTEKLRSLLVTIDKHTIDLKENTALLSQQHDNVEHEYSLLQQAMEESLMQEEVLQESTMQYQDAQAELTQQEAEQAEDLETQKHAEQTLTAEQQQLTNTEQQIAFTERQTQTVSEQLQILLQKSPEQELEQLQLSYANKTKQMALWQSEAKKAQSEIEQQTALCNEQDGQVAQALQKRNECQAQVSALHEVLESDQQTAQQDLLAHLRVESGSEVALERALFSLTHLNVHDKPCTNGVWRVTQQKPVIGSVAEVIKSDIYPSYLNHIQLIKAQQNFEQNGNWLLGVDLQGTLYGQNFSATLKNDNNLLLQHTKLRQLQAQLPTLEKAYQQKTSQQHEHRQALEHYQQHLTHLKEQIHSLAQEIASNQTQIAMLNEQCRQWQDNKHTLEVQCRQLNEQGAEFDKSQALQQNKVLEAQEILEKARVMCQQHNQNLHRAKQCKEQTWRALQDAQQQLHQLKLQEQKAQSNWQLSKSKSEHLQQNVKFSEIKQQEMLQEQELLQEPLLENEESIQQYLLQHEEIQGKVDGSKEAVSAAKHQLQDKQQSLKHAHAQVAKLNEKLQQLKLDEQGLTIKAHAALEPLNELKQTLKAVLSELPEQAQIASFQSKLSHVSKELSELGAVNLAAIEEFAQAKERKQYLDAQLEDLTSALETLESAIKKIDKETKSRFKATFDQVNEDLSELFPKVFGGGMAYLELTSDDLLESGVSIMARPPGKKNSTIHLLSGGEKALTALSLVFSIFRLNPAPFCMLDEVDAPLDDANVGRFCRLVEEMSQSVQFIYISHNKIAMEMASRLTGVTMAEPGVSRMVAVDIEQAVQMAHA